MPIDALSMASLQDIPRRGLARIVFFSFLLSFITARGLVILIMARKIPDMFLHVRGTHVHHLNYGIFLVTAVGAFLLFQRPTGVLLKWMAALYGLALALTFDEFGMWLHLGGSYWQRASFDAVVVVASLLAMLAFAPPLSRVRSAHGWALAIALLATAGFFYLWTRSFAYAEKHFAPRLHSIEKAGPP